MSTFRALIAEGSADRYATQFKNLDADALPPGDVLIDIAYSSLNYKDALAVTGRGKVIRRFPMVCGIDLSGRVLATHSPEFAVGDEVIVVGQGLGETRWGGYSQLGRVAAEAAVKLPAGLNLQQAMAVGTAGLTAMLSLIALEEHGVVAGDRELVVTGAAGGVGSIAVALLAVHGYNVAASTGRLETHAYLRELGATTIVDRADLAKKTAPLARSDGREGSTRSVDRRWRRSSPRPRRMALLLPAVSPGAPNCRRRCFRSSCGTSHCWGSTRSTRRDLCVPVPGNDSRMAASSRSSTRLPLSSRCRASETCVNRSSMARFAGVS